MNPSFGVILRQRHRPRPPAQDFRHLDDKGWYALRRLPLPWV